MMRYDFVIYGASGFTGQFVVDFVVRAEQEHRISWAVAGRSEDKLRTVLDRSGKVAGKDLSDKQLIICDCADQNSLLVMASQAKVVLNCVGPYRFWGEPVVEACVEAGAHHLDISGEPSYLEKMQLKYHQAALENGVYVIGACGFDSIPADIGQVCVRKAMEGDVNTLESYLKVDVPDMPGPSLNFGTWQTAVHETANTGLDKLRAQIDNTGLSKLRAQLYSSPLPATAPKLKHRGIVHHSPVVDDWCVPFMGTDKSVMVRTQQGFYHDKAERPTQIHAYVQLSSLFNCFLLIIFGAIFGLLARFKWGRIALENYPELCSMGRVSKAGPSKAKADRTNFVMTLVGEGWTHKIDADKDHVEPVTRRVTTVVKGNNIGYGATCECMVQAGIVLLKEPNRLPSAGGVYPPGYAFAETSLAERLTNHGVTFNTIVQNI